jgi:hypothetical protein
MARPHHYEFAHVALRNTFFSRPEDFAVALGRRQDELLRTIWSDVGDAVVKKHGPGARLSPHGLALTARRLGPGYLIIISLPTPERTGEAYHIGMVVSQRRFFTLEYGRNPRTEETYAVLCETQGQMHCNYGAGPEPTLDAFAGAVTQILEAGSDPTVRGTAEPGSSQS